MTDDIRLERARARMAAREAARKAAAPGPDTDPQLAGLGHAAREQYDALYTELGRDKAYLMASLTQEVEEGVHTMGRLADLLHGVCNGLKGKAPPRVRYSLHDLPEWALAAAAVANAALAVTAPGASFHQREDFVLTLQAWRALVGAQIARDAERDTP